MPYFVNEGHRLFYREQGSGAPLLLLPGNTSASPHLAGEMAYFSNRFHSAALDFWGTGQSERVFPWPVDWFQQAGRDAAALVKQLGAGPAVLIGTSGGAVAALWAAIQNPGAVRAVVFDSGQLGLPPAAAANLASTRRLDDPLAAEFWKSAHGEDWGGVVQADTAMLQRLGQQGGGFFDERVSSVACPVLITASLSDDMIADAGGQALKLSEMLPNSQVYLHRRGGHPLMWSQPEAFHRAVDAFLAGLA